MRLFSRRRLDDVLQFSVPDIVYLSFLIEVRIGSKRQRLYCMQNHHQVYMTCRIEKQFDVRIFCVLNKNSKKIAAL